MIDRIDRNITIEGPLDAEQRKRLMEIADKCPVHRTLESEIDPHFRAADLNFFAAGISNRYARRRACIDAAVPCLGGRSAAQLCGRGGLAAELSASVGLGRRHRQRAHPLRKRQQHETVTDSADLARAQTPQRELIVFEPALRKLRLR